MSRNLTAGTKAAFTATVVRPAVFVEAHFASGVVRLWSGVGPITWNGLTWLGVGSLGTISAMPETSDVQAQGISLTLSAIPSDMLAHVLNEIRQGMPCRVWLGALDEAGNVITDPYASMAGRIDSGVINEGGQTSSATITVETQLMDLRRTRERRYTDADQQYDFPGDLGFIYVAAVQNWNGVWGKGTGVPGSTSGNLGAGNGNPRTGAGGGRLSTQ